MCIETDSETHEKLQLKAIFSSFTELSPEVYWLLYRREQPVVRFLADFLSRLLQYQQSEGSLHLLVERCHAASEAPAQLYFMSTKEIFWTKELMTRKCRPKIIAALISGVMNILGFYLSHTARRQGLEFRPNLCPKTARRFKRSKAVCQRANGWLWST